MFKRSEVLIEAWKYFYYSEIFNVKLPDETDLFIRKFKIRSQFILKLIEMLL